MPTLTMPRIPEIGRKRTGADMPDAATTATNAPTDTNALADDRLAVVKAQRLRRVATIVAASLVVGAVATVLARRAAQARGAARSAKQ
ncbi:MAG TPA: hypothetical protein VID72_03000 [Ktedonobacterales bacterium]